MVHAFLLAMAHAFLLAGATVTVVERDGQAAEAARERGSQALGIVAAWRGLKKGKQLDEVLDRVRAVAAVEGAYCQGCYNKVTMNDVSKLMGAQVVVRCGSCQRMLYTS